MQILAKISGGYGLRGALNYDFAPCKKSGRPRAELICGTLQGTPRQICKQAAPLRGLRQISKPIWRASLNADPADGILTAEKWTEICHDFLLGMGLDPATTAWVAVRHSDHHDDPTPRDHVHLTVLRQQPDGSLFNVANDVFRSKKITQMLEIKHQLVTHDREPAARRAPTVGQKCAERRTGKMASKQTIQNKVDQVFSDEKNDLSFPTLKEKLRGKRIGILPKVSKEGRLMGFSYEDFETGVKIPGSKLGTDYSMGLLTRGLKFELKGEQKVDKMPPALKSILLPEQYGAKEIKPHAAHQTEVFLDTTKFNTQVANLNVGPASTAMLLIAGALAKASVYLVNMIIAFLKRLMAFFGLGIRSSTLQKYEHLGQSAPALCYESTQLAEDKAAQKLYEIVEALEANDPNLLPVLDDPEVVKARADVVKAMEEEELGGQVGCATAIDTENFGFTETDFKSTNAVTQPPKTKTDPLDDLKTALAAHEVAARALELAEIKNGPIHFSTVKVRQAELKIVRQDLESAREKWDEFCVARPLKWRLPSAEKTRLLQIIENNDQALKRSLKAVAAAEAEDLRIEKIYKTLPEAVIPAAILQAVAEAHQAIKTALEAIQIEAVEAIIAVRSDVMMLPKMAEFESSLSSSFRHIQREGKITADEFNVLNSRITELRRIKNAQDAVRRAAMAEYDDDANKPAAAVVDCQTVK